MINLLMCYYYSYHHKGRRSTVESFVYGLLLIIVRPCQFSFTVLAVFLKLLLVSYFFKQEVSMSNVGCLVWYVVGSRSNRRSPQLSPVRLICSRCLFLFVGNWGLFRLRGLSFGQWKWRRKEGVGIRKDT